MKLSRNELQPRLLLESSSQPMWIYDQETLAFLAVNEAAIRHYGYSRREFLRMTIKDLRPPAEIPRLLEHIATQRNAGRRPVSHGIWKHCKKDGTLCNMEITASR